MVALLYQKTGGIGSANVETCQAFLVALRGSTMATERAASRFEPCPLTFPSKLFHQVGYRWQIPAALRLFEPGPICGR